MFVGAYWGPRAETNEQIVERLVTFLQHLADTSGEFSAWYRRSRRKADARRTQIPITTDGISNELSVNRTDIGGQVIPELGYGFVAWNGRDASLRASLGTTSEYVKNSVVLKDSSQESRLTDADWRSVHRRLIDVFDPDEAFVAENSLVAAAETDRLFDLGWLTYQRGSLVVEHASRR